MSDTAGIMARLQTVFRDVFDDDTIVLRPETSAADIPDWDSLNQLKLIFGSEQAFGIRLKARDINALSNVAEMVDHIARAVRGKAG